MPQIVIQLLSSTRFVTFIVSFVLVLVKDKFPDLGLSEQDIAELLPVAIAVIVGDTIRPVNPAKPPLVGAKPQ